MTKEEIETELSLLLTEFEGDFGDRHEMHLRVRQMVDKSLAFGHEPPADLLELLKALETPAERDEDVAVPPHGHSRVSRIIARKKEAMDHQKTAESSFRRR